MLMQQLNTPIFKLLSTLLIWFGGILLYRGPNVAVWFFWHPVFALLSLLPFSLIGIFFQQTNRLAVQGPKISSANSDGNTTSTKKKFSNLWHNCFMIISTFCMLFSVYVIWTNKDINGKPHLTSNLIWFFGGGGVLFLICVNS